MSVQTLRDLFERTRHSAVVWIWGVTAIRLLNFVLILPLALRTLEPELIGLWYVMLNIVGGVTLVELGMTTAIARQVSFSIGSGDPRYDQIHSLIVLSQKLYAALAAVALAGCVAGGIWLAVEHPHLMLTPAALVSFGLIVLASVFRMTGLFWNPLLFGMHRVQEAQQIQFVGILASYAVTLAGLFTGLGIVALAVGQVVNLIYPMIRSRRRFRQIFPEVFLTEKAPAEWKGIWFATWRTGIIMLGSWMGTQGLIIVAGQRASLEAAASFSISFIVALTVHTLSQSWLLARFPVISSLWASGRFEEIRVLFKRRLFLTVGTMVVGAVGVWILLPALLHLIGSQTAPLPPVLLAVLLVVVFLDLVVGSFSAALISCNQFPHVLAMSLSGAATMILALLFAGKYGLYAVVAAPLICLLALNIWYVPRLFFQSVTRASGRHSS